MSHGPSNGNPFSWLWSGGLCTGVGGACRHAGRNPRPSFSLGEDERATTQGEDAGMDQQIAFYLGHFQAKQRRGKQEKEPPQTPPHPHRITKWRSFPRVIASLCSRVAGLPAAAGGIYLIWVRRAMKAGRIWGKMQIHGSLIFTYTWSRRELDFFEAGLLV